ncbi:DUF2059 domain-containing protein [Jannaschia aquimarina]|uniref:DUF2059 domain-containing protein n=1 Tax=Jannaschia aquimarina TaxID=935700 RepID=A0A0D1EHS3_9RHOB|nr:DUF2059 domain-containing protein [Jannaschia aquimarina]KIT15370.1 hypothetical protein jaqu_28020 [Jannaschia aquimarina]SNT23296.1 hypothetical protein SAMN05421775_108112 [Jannaschia aquimarina]
MAQTRLRVAILASAIGLAGFAEAQEDDRRALARTYVDMPANQAMMDQMMGADVLAAQFTAGLPPQVELSPGALERIGALMSEAMTSLRPKMQEMMVEGAAETFTAAELRALIEFYSTPEGEGVLLKMPPYFSRTMSELMPEIMQAMSARQTEIIAIIEEGRQ